MGARDSHSGRQGARNLLARASEGLHWMPMPDWHACWPGGQPQLPRAIPATVRRVAVLPLEDPYRGRVDVLQVTAHVSCVVELNVQQV